MKRPLPKLGVEWAVLGFCAWQATDLWTAWRHSPFDRWGWVALAIWLLPTGASVGQFRTPEPVAHRGVLLSWLALAACLIGLLTDMHFLKHAALALACAAVTSPFRLRGLWFLLALAWMPALGWLLANFPSVAVCAARLGLATIAALVAWVGRRRHLPKALA